jgi:RimJ/RimL family protein N-acetyltransferase
MRLPERIEGGGLVLRRWRAADAELLHEAVVDSVEHLRPWMPWLADEPKSVEQRTALIEGWERDWEGGGDVVLAIVHDGVVAGGSGLHRRRGPGALEIGYWLRPDFVGRGIVTTAARLLTTAAFAVDGIERVEIWHELGNTASGAVPARLGFTAVGEVDGDRVWRTTREEWALVSSDA